MNTYGLHSITSDTFNLRWHTDHWYPRPARNVLVTAFRLNNLVLNVLGYIPGVRNISGCVRMGIGALICVVTLAIGDRDAKAGAIIGHWYDEALLTGTTQMVRGALEAFVPSGWMVNAALDVAGTIYNVMKELGRASVCAGCMGYKNHGPHPEPRYYFPFNLLYLV